MALPFEGAPDTTVSSAAAEARRLPADQALPTAATESAKQRSGGGSAESAAPRGLEEDHMDPYLAQLSSTQQLQFAGGALFRALLALSPKPHYFYFTLFLDAATGSAAGLIALTGIDLRGNRQFEILVDGRPSPGTRMTGSVEEATQSLLSRLHQRGTGPSPDFGQPCVCDSKGQLITLQGESDTPIGAQELCKGPFAIFTNASQRRGWQAVIAATLAALAGPNGANLSWQSVYADVKKAISKTGGGSASGSPATLATVAGGGGGAVAAVKEGFPATTAVRSGKRAAPPSSDGKAAAKEDPGSAAPTPPKRARNMSARSANALGMLALAAQSSGGGAAMVGVSPTPLRPAGTLLQLGRHKVHAPSNKLQTAHVRAAILAAERKASSPAPEPSDDELGPAAGGKALRLVAKRAPTRLDAPRGPSCLTTSDRGAFATAAKPSPWYDRRKRQAEVAVELAARAARREMRQKQFAPLSQQPYLPQGQPAQAQVAHQLQRQQQPIQQQQAMQQAMQAMQQQAVQQQQHQGMVMSAIPMGASRPAVNVPPLASSAAANGVQHPILQPLQLGNVAGMQQPMMMMPSPAFGGGPGGTPMVNQFGQIMMMSGTPIIQGTGSPGSFFMQLQTPVQAGGPTQLGANVQGATKVAGQPINLKPVPKAAPMSVPAKAEKATKKPGPGRKLAQDTNWPAEWLDIPCVQFNRFIKNSNMSTEQIAELKRARRRRKNRAYAKRSRDKKNARIEETLAKYHDLKKSVGGTKVEEPHQNRVHSPTSESDAGLEEGEAFHSLQAAQAGRPVVQVDE